MEIEPRVKTSLLPYVNASSGSSLGLKHMAID